MKIHSGISESVSFNQDYASGKATNSPAAQSNSASQADQASFSSQLQKAVELKAKALDQPEVRQDVVTALRQKISSGEYKVDPRKVADAIFSEYKQSK